MAFDWIDGMAVVGALALAAAAFTLEGIVVAAAFGGFALSLAVWRLYGGRPWEALGWLAWVGAAGTLVLDIGGGAFLTLFLGFGLVGVFLLIGGRFGYLRDVWSVDSSDA
ncbi:hypothetical protein [Natronolimnobius baerhuensis]|uniref:Uncharacterized protein n=1 Tax=Natronolimnobius baerhuensis TaxID=253108 RepID=A0A202E8B4_9EURY|nr:hypothetical protein [Natronolimnobius baerhuensis]OVE84516.1 hypothetical protein B2G88_08910 [Natronolimnobius baerhuensis]